MESLYHYTDLNAVVSIFQSLKLRATSIQYLNDSEEYRNGFELFSKALRDSLTLPPNKNFGCYSSYEGALQFLNTYVAEDMDMWCSLREFFFVTSFSRSPDQLSQWRGYGPYCLEFNESALKEHMKLYSCIYEDEQKKASVRAEVDSAASEITMKAESDEVESIHWNIGYEMLRAPTIYKHSGFIEEAEVRAVFMCESDVKRDNVLYRIKGDILIPYVEVPISAQCIKSITVGPMKNQELAAASLQNLVEGWKRRNLPINSSCQVHLSRIPYRAH